MTIMKAYLFGFIKYVFREWLMYVPSRRVRMFFIRLATNHVGSGVYVAMGLDLRGTRGKVRIGNDCVINKRVLLDGRGEIIIGNNVDIGQETNIWTAEHDPNSDKHETRIGKVVIEDYVWLATRVTILPDVTIGKGAVVATGSIVTKSVPSMAIVAGVPAKIIGWRNNKLNYKLVLDSPFT
jgi:acetyltransferase-like isoleucine patch superfamily enzyme